MTQRPIEELMGGEVIPIEAVGGPADLRPDDPRSPTTGAFSQMLGGGTVGAQQSAAIIRERRAARQRQEQRRQEIISGAVNNYDPEQRFSNFWLQADTARSRSFSDVQAKFRDTYPDGEIIAVPISSSVVDDTGRGQTVVVARASPDEPFREYSAIGPRVLEALASEEALGAVAGATLAGSRIPGPLGPSVAVAGGVLAGSLAKYSIERARGYEEATGLPEAFSRAYGEGAVAGALDIVLRGGLTIGRAAYFRPSGDELVRREGLRDIQQFAREADLTPIARGQASEHPILRQMFQQTGTSRLFDEFTEGQRRALINSWRSWRDSQGAQGGISREALERATMAQAYELEGPLARQLMRATDATDINAAGQSIREGLENFEQMSRQLTNRLYDDALRLGQGVSFDASRLHSVAATINTGTPIRTAQGIGRAEGALHSEIRSVIDDISAIPRVMSPDNIAGRQVQPYEQLKAMRTRLFNLTHHDEGSVRGPAKQLYRALTETMESPVGGGRAFIDAWRNASSVHRQLEATLETSIVRQFMASDTPERLARRLMTPGNGSSVRLVREILESNPETRGNWQLFRNAFITQLRDNPAEGLARLDSFRRSNDLPTLRLLLNESEEQGLRRIAEEMVRHESGAISQVARRNFEQGEAGRTFIQRATRQDVDDYVRAVGGRESADAVNLKVSVIDDILNRASRLNESGQQVMNPSILNSILDDIVKTGRFNSLFTRAELDAVRNYQRYAAIIEQSIDVGGTMQRASVAAGMKDPLKPSKFQSAVRTLVSNSIAAHILARPASFRELARVSVTATDAVRIRALAQALHILNNEYDEEPNYER